VDLEQVEKIRREVRGSPADEFVALEKVHGSNFAFEIDGDAGNITYFSRNRRLDARERFVGKTAPYEAMSRYHGAVVKAFQICQEAAAALGSADVESVIIYGEYFGGWYPQEGVAQEGPGAGVPVQKGVVAYAPGHHFFAFDVCVDGAYLDYDDARDVLSRAGFPLVATPIVRGTFDDCMRFDIDSFRTTIPGLLSLPPCRSFSIAEGLVIRPVQRREAWTVKRKSVQYLEACPNELRKWLNKCVENKAEAFAGLYLSLCQLPRLDAVLSKEPQLRSAGVAAEKVASLMKVQQLFREDVQEAFEKKLREIRVTAPADVCKAARAEADRRVEEWLQPGAVAGW
jgi:Rnl2 family RNA ligase